MARPAGALLAAEGGHAAAYGAATGLVGNQAWSGTLGLDFTVNATVSVNSLGAFNSGGGGINGHVFTTIFNASGATVTPTVDFFGAANPTSSAYVFQSIGPVSLAPGQYQLASWGYGPSDFNFNTYGANPGPIDFDTLGGYLAANGSRYSNPENAGTLATNPDNGATRYGAGSFSATALGILPPPPEPGPLGPGIYDAPTGLAGNQTWGGTLGLDFLVNRPIRLSALGTFDNGGDGIAGSIKAVIFNAMGQAVTPTLDFAGQPNPTGAAFVFKSLGRNIVLAPGTYQLASWGYSALDSNFNTYGANPGPVTFDVLGGRLTALGSRYSGGGGGSLGTIPDVGATRYGGGSFLAGSAPEPATWAMMVMGFGGLGAMVRKKARGGQVYRLVEATADGWTSSEEFIAPDDRAALGRVVKIAGGEFELWRGDVLVPTPAPLS